MRLPVHASMLALLFAAPAIATSPPPALLGTVDGEWCQPGGTGCAPLSFDVYDDGTALVRITVGASVVPVAGTWSYAPRTGVLTLTSPTAGTARGRRTGPCFEGAGTVFGANVWWRGCRVP